MTLKRTIKRREKRQRAKVRAAQPRRRPLTMQEMEWAQRDALRQLNDALVFASVIDRHYDRKY